jgi:CCR4-NOT transcription complex subunit 2
MRGHTSRATRVRLTSTIKGNADAENQTKYGLLGLLDVIRMTNADLNTLALGSDLTTLGLNLNSSECLYSTFASPWAEAPITREPQFSLPLCYYMQPPPLKTQYLSQNKLCLALLTAPSFVSHYAT